MLFESFSVLGVHNIFNKFLSILEGEKVHVHLFFWVPALSVRHFAVFSEDQSNQEYKVYRLTFIFVQQRLQNNEGVALPIVDLFRTLTSIKRQLLLPRYEVVGVFLLLKEWLNSKPVIKLHFTFHVVVSVYSVNYATIFC